MLTRAFGAPAVLAEALKGVGGITAAYIYRSWAARHAGQQGQRPVGDIDVLILGDPHRDQLYNALSTAEARLGWADQSRRQSATPPGWNQEPVRSMTPLLAVPCSISICRTGNELTGW